MLQSNHSKQDDGQCSTTTGSRSHVPHGQQVPAAVRLTPPAVSTSLCGVPDAAAVSESPATELGERYNVRRDSRRPSNVGESSFNFYYYYYYYFFFLILRPLAQSRRIKIKQLRLDMAVT